MKQSSLKQIIKTHDISWALIDAAGVFYNSKDGMIKESIKAVHSMQNLGINIGLLTNNSMHHPTDIKAWFLREGIELNEKAIITSGLCTRFEPKLHPQLINKRVFIVGKDKCFRYFREAGVKEIVSQPEDADVITLMSYSGDLDDEYMDHLASVVNKNECPVICCNTDIYVKLDGGLLPVVGYFAKELDRRMNHNVQWFGKPFVGYFEMAKRLLTERFNLKWGHTIMYFDDLVENLRGAKQSGEIVTVHIYETGLDGFELSKAEPLIDYQLSGLIY